jgi:hypothetical protein
MFKFELFGIQADGSLGRHNVEGLYPTLQEAIEAAREIASSAAFPSGYRVTAIVPGRVSIKTYPLHCDEGLKI